MLAPLSGKLDARPVSRIALLWRTDTVPRMRRADAPIPGRPRARSHHVIGRVPSGTNVSYGGAGSDVAASADSTVDASQGLYGDMRLHGCPECPGRGAEDRNGGVCPAMGE